MIISASRRTDLPAFYPDWLFNRFREGRVLVRNPMNPHAISDVRLSPDVVDGIVLWTKNPLPMLSRLSELDRYPYYFQFTLTAYGTDVEPSLPSKTGVLAPAFQTLSRKIGRERVVWRYDPIFFSARYTADEHCRRFRRLASLLGPYTEKCTISFLDFYRDTARNTRPLRPLSPTAAQRFELAGRLTLIAAEYGLTLDTCAVEEDYSQLGVSHADCIDLERLERIGGWRLNTPRAKGQRPACGCAESVDIGAYATCPGGCRYCYAGTLSGTAQKNRAAHDPRSPLLFGEVSPKDKIVVRAACSQRDGQLRFPS